MQGELRPPTQNGTGQWRVIHGQTYHAIQTGTSTINVERHLNSYFLSYGPGTFSSYFTHNKLNDDQGGA